MWTRWVNHSGPTILPRLLDIIFCVHLRDNQTRHRAHEPLCYHKAHESRDDPKLLYVMRILGCIVTLFFSVVLWNVTKLFFYLLQQTHHHQSDTICSACTASTSLHLKTLTDELVEEQLVPIAVFGCSRSRLSLSFELWNFHKQIRCGSSFSLSVVWNATKERSILGACAMHFLSSKGFLLRSNIGHCLTCPSLCQQASIRMYAFFCFGSSTGWGLNPQHSPLRSATADTHPNLQIIISFI